NPELRVLNRKDLVERLFEEIVSEATPRRQSITERTKKHSFVTSISMRLRKEIINYLRIWYDCVRVMRKPHKQFDNASQPAIIDLRLQNRVSAHSFDLLNH